MAKENKMVTWLVLGAGVLGLGLVISKAREEEEKALVEGLDSEELARGAHIEMTEHGLEEDEAKRIAADHLRENPGYYEGEKS
jgi:hypothetical protein